jgi:hypothetical protein
MAAAAKGVDFISNGLDVQFYFVIACIALTDRPAVSKRMAMKLLVEALNESWIRESVCYLQIGLKGEQV